MKVTYLCLTLLDEFGLGRCGFCHGHQENQMRTRGMIYMVDKCVYMKVLVQGGC